MSEMIETTEMTAPENGTPEMLTNKPVKPKRAKSVSEVLSTRMDTFAFDGDWYQAFGHPERTGVWLVWGNSGNGKTTFVLQLCKYLCRFERVLYNSLEEGVSLTMRNALQRCGMMDVNRRFLLLDREPIEQLEERLNKRRSPGVVVIDSFQYTQMNYAQYLGFKERHRDKLIILVSHAQGRQPSGRSTRSVMYDASQKIYIEGYRAFSRGRFLGPKKQIDIWPEEAAIYWGENF